jgi:flagellar assembly protein FliH
VGLIKRNQLEEKGTILIEKSPLIIHRREEPAVIETVSEETVGEDRDAIRARSEAGRIKEAAREEGRREGREEASARIEEALETLNQAVKERKKIVKDAENEIVRLALKVAEQIIRSEVSMHRDVCLNIVSEAIGRVSDREQIIVKVNREDAEYLKRYKDRLAGMLDGVKSFSIVEDSNIEPGGCVIETNLGFIDARIGTKIKAIEEALNKVKSEEHN